MNDSKITANKTGTILYTKLPQASKGYRIRFRSFQQNLYENREVINNLEQIQASYNLFKYGKSRNKRSSQPEFIFESRPSFSANMKDICKDSDDMKRRLKSMRETRKSLFERVKLFKDV